MEPNRTPKQYLIKFTLATNELKIRFQSDYDYSQEDSIPHLYDEIKHLIQLSHDKAKTDEKETIFASNIKLFMDGKEEAIFAYCTSLTDINIPNSVTSIGEQAFYNCDNLKSVYMNASTPPFIGSQAFHNISKDLTIYIPRGSYTAYWLSYWGNYNLVEYDPTDIQGVTTSAHNGVEKYFSIDGRPLPGPCKGVNIIQDTDGKTRKAWIP